MGLDPTFVSPAAKSTEREGLPGSPPEPFEATTRDPGVMDRVFGVSMPEVILDQPQVVASVGEVEAA